MPHHRVLSLLLACTLAATSCDILAPRERCENPDHELGRFDETEFDEACFPVVEEGDDEG